VVEIPEREHTLAEADTNTPAMLKAILDFRSRQGGQRPIGHRRRTDDSSAVGRPGTRPLLSRQLMQSPQAQNVLTTDSDFSRVKVTRRDRRRAGNANGFACQQLASATQRPPYFPIRGLA